MICHVVERAAVQERPREREDDEPERGRADRGGAGQLAGTGSRTLAVIGGRLLDQARLPAGVVASSAIATNGKNQGM